MRTLPAGETWVAHTGKLARLRHLLRLTSRLVVPPECEARIVAIVERVSEPVDRVHLRLEVLNVARVMAVSTGAEFEDVLDNRLTKLEAEQRAHA